MKGYAAIPMLAVHDAEAALSYYKNVFGAFEVNKMLTEDGKIAHSEITINSMK